jgi:hypothetical protein
MGRRLMVIGLIGAGVLLATGSVLAAEAATTQAAAKAVAAGRWNLMVTVTVEKTDPSGEKKTDTWSHPAWLAIERQGSKYVGRFLGGAGSVHPIGDVKVDEAGVEFNAGDRKWIGKIEGDNITGTWEKGQEKGTWSGKRSVPKTDVAGTWTIKPLGTPIERPAVAELIQSDRQITGTYQEGDKKYPITDGVANAGIMRFSVELPSGKKTFGAAVKGDLLDDGMILTQASKLGGSFKGYRQRKWGEAIELFNGKDLSNWEQFGDLKNMNWKVVDGIMTTTGGANIVSKDKFRNFRMHVEFMVPSGGNSGVYLRGRHEIQVSDSIGSTPPSWHDCGALYSRIAPGVNACKKADTWQTFDILMINNYVTVVFNGQIIIDSEEVEGITGGMLDSNEDEPGPIYLQGDHGKISYRKITVWPAK